MKSLNRMYFDSLTQNGKGIASFVSHVYHKFYDETFSHIITF